jgi:hypothetical protein
VYIQRIVWHIGKDLKNVFKLGIFSFPFSKSEDGKFKWPDIRNRVFYIYQNPNLQTFSKPHAAHLQHEAYVMYYALISYPANAIYTEPSLSPSRLNKMEYIAEGGHSQLFQNAILQNACCETPAQE